MKWDGKTPLDQYDDGVILNNIPLNHPVILASLNVKNVQNSAWWGKVDRIVKGFDQRKFQPIYYCKKCNWIENGGHRIAVAKKLERNIISVQIHNSCISNMTWVHSYRGNWNPPWGQKLPFVDIVIPTLGRLDELETCLNHIYAALIPRVSVHVYFSDLNELKKFRKTYGEEEWLNYYFYGKSGKDFNMTEFWHIHMRKMKADIMGYFVNDQEMDKDCIRFAIHEFMKSFPDGDGVVGVSTIAPVDMESFGEKYKAGDSMPHVGCAFIGKKFAARFPNFQFFCPDYFHMFPARDLLKTAKEWERVKLSKKSKVRHRRIGSLDKKPDKIFNSLRDRFKKNDLKVFRAREKRDLCWGLDWTLIREDVLHEKDRFNIKVV